MSVLRYILGVTFILSGLLKIVAPSAVVQSIIQYLSLLGIGYSDLPLRMMAIALCIGEITIGIIACVRWLFRKISLLYVFVLFFFTVLTYINLTSPYGGMESCGCFGELIHLSPMETFIKNLLLLGISVVLYCRRNLNKIVKINIPTN